MALALHTRQTKALPSCNLGSTRGRQIKMPSPQLVCQTVRTVVLEGEAGEGTSAEAAAWEGVCILWSFCLICILKRSLSAGQRNSGGEQEEFGVMS